MISIKKALDLLSNSRGKVDNIRRAAKDAEAAVADSEIAISGILFEMAEQVSYGDELNICRNAVSDRGAVSVVDLREYEWNGSAEYPRYKDGEGHVLDVGKYNLHFLTADMAAFYQRITFSWIIFSREKAVEDLEEDEKANRNLH